MLSEKHATYEKYVRFSRVKILCFHCKSLLWQLNMSTFVLSYAVWITAKSVTCSSSLCITSDVISPADNKEIVLHLHKMKVGGFTTCGEKQGRVIVAARTYKAPEMRI